VKKGISGLKLHTKPSKYDSRRNEAIEIYDKHKMSGLGLVHLGVVNIPAICYFKNDIKCVKNTSFKSQ